jgi:hypothetical protein
LNKLSDDLKSRNEENRGMKAKLEIVTRDLERSESEKVVMAEEIVTLREEKAALEQGNSAQ